MSFQPAQFPWIPDKSPSEADILTGPPKCPDKSGLLAGNAGEAWLRVINKKAAQAQNAQTDEWVTPHDEGELRVDVYQTENELVVHSAMAGVKPEHLEIFLHHDLLTVRGKRECEDLARSNQVFSQECFWGKFSRSIILPVDVKADEARAVLKHGLLTITLPKNKIDYSIPVELEE